MGTLLKGSEQEVELARKNARIAELHKLYVKWQDKYRNERRRVVRLREKMKEVNHSEIEQLNLEITRLRAEINQLKRDRRDARKYKKIYEIVTGEVME